MREYALCVDLGKKRDRAVFFVMKDVPQIVDGDRRFDKPDRLMHLYDITFIDQFMRVSYPQLIDNLCVLQNHKELAQNSDLLVDGRGVGEGVVDQMRDKGLCPISIVATNGDRVHWVSEEMGKIFSNVPGKLRPMMIHSQVNVPKVDLVSAGLTLAEQGRVGVAKGLHWGEEFKRQLMHFKDIKDKKTGHHKAYEADSEEVHDDLVFTYLMAAWWFTRGGEADRPQEETLSGGSGQRTVDWDPLDYT